MDLIRISERVWIAPFEDERDRPVLGYILGEKRAFAVDAGHSDGHVNEFYDALKREELPLPDVTVITHWHWDHSFAMHCIHGLSLAGRKTNAHLKAFREQLNEETKKLFLASDPCIEKEYAGGREMIVVTSDIEFENRIVLDGGGISLQVFEAVSPHTDDTVLILVPEERILFTGDAVCGEYPTEYADPEKTKALAETVRTAEADLFISGHWKIRTKEEVLRVLKEML